MNENALKAALERESLLHRQAENVAAENPRGTAVPHVCEAILAIACLDDLHATLLSARILALVDTYDALRSRRCYKESYDHAQARELIASMSGSHFDPRVADAFLECGKESESIWSRLNTAET